jgi:hypothetical protein
LTEVPSAGATGYTRATIVFAAAAGIATNASTTFPLAALTWGTITHIAVYSNGSTTRGTGELVFWVDITDVPVAANDTVTIAAAAITMTIT